MMTYLIVAFLWIVAIKILQLEPSRERLPVKVKFEGRVTVGTAVWRFFQFKESWLIIITAPLAILASSQIAHPLFWLDFVMGAIPFPDLAAGRVDYACLYSAPLPRLEPISRSRRAS